MTIATGYDRYSLIAAASKLTLARVNASCSPDLAKFAAIITVLDLGC